WPTNHLVVDLSLPAGILAVLLLVFGISILVALHVKRFGTNAIIESPVIVVIWLQAGIFFLTLLTTAGGMMGAVWHHAVADRRASWLLTRFGAGLIDDLWWL